MAEISWGEILKILKSSAGVFEHKVLKKSCQNLSNSLDFGPDSVQIEDKGIIMSRHAAQILNHLFLDLDHIFCGSATQHPCS